MSKLHNLHCGDLCGLWHRIRLLFLPGKFADAKQTAVEQNQPKEEEPKEPEENEEETQEQEPDSENRQRKRIR